MNSDLNPDFNNMLHRVRRESLSDAERGSIRRALQAFMADHPAQAPLAVRMLDSIERFTFAPHSVYGRVLAGACALVLVVGVGTSYAAQNALPGDLLYPIKVDLNEAVVGAFQVSQSAKAQWNAAQVSRRLQEAETLAAEDRLTPVARAEIETQINASAHDFDTNVAALEKANDTMAITAVQTDLQASLDGHAQVLAALSGTTLTGTSLEPIITNVHAHAVAIAAAQQRVNATVASATPSVAETVALQLKDQAVAALDRTHNAAKKNGNGHKGTVAAVSALKSGDEKLDKGDYSGAFNAFQTAARVAKTAEVNLDVSNSLGIATPSSGTSGATTPATSTATSTATTTQQQATTTPMTTSTSSTMQGTSSTSTR